MEQDTCVHLCSAYVRSIIDVEEQRWGKIMVYGQIISREYSPLCLPSLVPMILAAFAGKVASNPFPASSSDENSNMPPPTPPRLRSALDDLAKSNSWRAIRAPNAGSLGENKSER